MSYSALDRWVPALAEFLPSFVENSPALRAVAPESSCLLHGSTTHGVDDAVSDLDVWLLVPPELLAGGVAAWGGAERRPSPAAFTARHVCHVAAVKVGLRVAPYIGERTVGLAAGDNTAVLVAAFAFADLASPVEKHGTRILRLAERKMNTVCSNG